jgi:hypothetical protein
VRKSRPYEQLARFQGAEAVMTQRNDLGMRRQMRDGARQVA